MKKNLIPFFVVAFPFLLFAQENCFFTHYSSEDGLLQNTVMNMLQDRKGNMWFATWDGINKFDGYTFTTYKASQGNRIGLTNNRVDYIREDRYGFLWLLAYDNSVHRFDPRTETFEHILAEGGETAYEINSIRMLPNGTAWLLTEKGNAIRATTDPENFRVTTTGYPGSSDTFSATGFAGVFQDKAGNEWLLTNNGLGFIREGKDAATSYFASEENTRNHPEHSFYAAEENTNELFFGTGNGNVWRYGKEKGKFTLLELPAKSPIVSILNISGHEIIIVSSLDGFFVYNTETGQLTPYAPSKNKEMMDAPVLSAYKGNDPEVWFEQEVPGCVVHFNPATGVIKRERIAVEQTSADRSHPAFHVHEDLNGRVWVHPFGGGFSCFDKESNSLVPFYNQSGYKNWKFSNKIHSAFSDRQGNLWLGTHSKGLDKITFQPEQFNLTTPYPDANESLGNEVRALLEDGNRNIWAGYKNGLIRIYDKNGRYTGYLNEDGTIAHTGGPLRGVPYFLTQDSRGAIWIATKGDGLVRAQKTGANTYKIERYVYDADDIYSLSNDNVYCVYEDSNKRIWVATFAGGLNYMDVGGDGKIRFINHRNHLKNYPVGSCYKARFVTSDTDGRIWVGTTAGVISFDGDFASPEDILFAHYSRIPEDPHSLSNNDVHWIIHTKRNELFLATSGGGLNKLVSADDGGKAGFKSYTVREGLPSDVLLSVREDDKDNLWIATENGISKFDPARETFENYGERSIALRVRFNEAASCVVSTKEMVFGTNKGVFRFHPDSLFKSDFVPPLTFSRLLVVNREVAPGENPLLESGLDDAEKLILTHRENTFTIQYAALDFTGPPNIQYAYMLDGFDRQWTYADKLRVATYTNIPKGSYTFRVRSTNSDGVWVDNTRSLDITVLPSFRETPLAYLLYVLFILLIILIAVYILFTIYRLRHQVDVEHQISDMKLRFFTNISHELRTPLTLIAGPVENILKDESLPAGAREQLRVVERSTNRMLHLVNQILDFRKIQNNKMKMRVQRLPVVSFVRKVMGNYDSLASENSIDFIFETERNDIHLWVDEDKFEKIIFNLLSNAFKYTPKGKMIAVYIREDRDTISIEVRDQGIGIAENKKDSLFVRFENLVDKNLFRQTGSSGIGLSLVKELAEMHHAGITVESKLGEGSCFRVEFKKGRNHFGEETEFIIDDSTDTPPPGEVTEGSDLPVAKKTDAEQSLAPKTMLLVEDNGELRSFLRTIFEEKFLVIEAVDGMDGWHKALNCPPDIIISDVMMPGKDGIEMMKELRADLTTSHIPIILLTAKTAIETKLEGLEFGADDYITKPFSTAYLEARVENILKQRAKLQDMYRNNLMNTTGKPQTEEMQQPELNPIDKKFMDKLEELMEKNMDNSSLVVDDLARELAVSRSVFFKKLKTLIGSSPIEFIKEVRIKRAAQLIESGEFNMSQISYMTGINDPRYFSKCFKQIYRMTPTEYKNKFGKQGR